jgi:very-short-patch-repair endonuclease
VFCCGLVWIIEAVSQGLFVDPRGGGECRDLAADAVIAELAGRQHGVVGRTQLLAAGIGAKAVESRLRSGRLHPLYRGVYAVGHRVVSQTGRWMAATLATGGVLSHRSAAALWGMRGWEGRIEITTRSGMRPRTGLLLHRAVLAPDEITTHESIPVTTPERTQLDLAGVLQKHQLQQVINEAERLQLPGAHELTRRHPTKKGIAGLKAPVAHTKRDLEARFSTFLNDRRFPPPQTNILIEGVEVDAAWPDRKLIIELDSWEYHHTRQEFERDRQRDRRLAAKGWTVLRITWRDLDEPGRLAAELAWFF